MKVQTKSLKLSEVALALHTNERIIKLLADIYRDLEDE